MFLTHNMLKFHSFCVESNDPKNHKKYIWEDPKIEVQ